ncbi:hypothetical protein AB3Y40_11415 [Yoonia sp. R2331]|uniref:hypothetical protein n=1 Tax=Yoonia sp. R2331 TaxID=3237238 RepID=UPI0034E39F16
MKQIACALALTLSAASASAQDTDEGLDLMEEGAKLLLRGLMTEMEPALRELEDFADEVGPAMKLLADEMGPALAELMAQIDDIRNYDPPEILPNGDIIIRRRPDAPVYEPGEEIEL